ncbi:Luciferin 4-monooxygenase [Frankliniella fusca]|uniref:Luciferin 4-monooxygenase n=1 Tax=Frankliniella fusca TaxID=407009 RepID=A0AAE1I3A7_9NEOP|nr:Luciferin 4-monooxygenase [Frankliniella fusca]
MDDVNVLRGEPLPPVPQISLGQYLLSNLQQKGDEVAQIDVVTGETQTFQQILTKSNRAAHYLYGLGIRPGDVVGISSENNLDFFIPVLAAFYNGAACAPFNPAYTEGELEHSMNISRPRIVFASSLTISRVIKAAENIDSIRDIVLIGRTNPGPLPYNIRRLSDFINSPQCSSSTFIPAQVNHERDVCLILCSSGTTGLPKGVELTHRNFITFIQVCMLGALPQHDDNGPENLLGLLPFYHGYGFALLSLAIVRGDKVVVFPRFEEELFLRAVQDFKISTLYVVPPLMVFLAKHPIVDKYNLSQVKTIICGAAPLNKDTQDAVSMRIGVKDIRQGYGMTETSILATAAQNYPVKLGSSGRVVQGFMAKIVDVETGKSLPRNKEGEICFKGPMIMKGYRNNKEATVLTIDKDGWLHTGDIGYFDNDGDIFVVDRIKELIKYKGFQVAPAELEAVLYTNKAVRDACVVGKPDEISGEIPVAFVVLQPNMKVTEKELVDYVNGKFLAFKPILRHEFLHKRNSEAVCALCQKSLATPVVNYSAEFYDPNYEVAAYIPYRLIRLTSVSYVSLFFSQHMRLLY